MDRATIWAIFFKKHLVTLPVIKKLIFSRRGQFYKCSRLNTAPFIKRYRRPGLPDFSWYKTPKRKSIPNYHELHIPNVYKILHTKDRKMDQVSMKYVYQHLPLHDPPKFTQIWIFGLKTNHLATLPTTRCRSATLISSSDKVVVSTYICTYVQGSRLCKLSADYFAIVSNVGDSALFCSLLFLRCPSS
jgi:hypothetical protein